MTKQLEQWASVLTLAGEVKALRQRLQRIQLERAQVLRDQANILIQSPRFRDGTYIQSLLRSAARWERLGTVK